MFDPFQSGKASLYALSSKWLVTVVVASLLSSAAGAAVIYLFLAGMGVQIPRTAVTHLPAQVKPFSIDNIPLKPPEQDVEILPPEASGPVISFLSPGSTVDVAGSIPSGAFAPIEPLSPAGAASGEQASEAPETTAASPGAGEGKYGAVTASLAPGKSNQTESGSVSDERSRGQHVQGLSHTKKTGAAKQLSSPAGKHDKGSNFKSKCCPGKSAGRENGRD